MFSFLTPVQQVNAQDAPLAQEGRPSTSAAVLPTTGGLRDDSRRRLSLFGGQNGRVTPPDIHTVIASLEAASANPSKPGLIADPKRLFGNVESLLKGATPESGEIPLLQEKVLQLLGKIHFRRQEAADIEPAHQFFNHAVPAAKGHGRSLSSASTASSRNGYQPLNGNDDKLVDYRQAVSGCIAERYIDEVNYIVGARGFSSAEFGKDTWQYQFLRQMESMVNKKTLQPEALTTLANWLHSLSPDVRDTDFAMAGDYGSEVRSSPVRFLANMDEALKSYRS
jgi:hypothetical protein